MRSLLVALALAAAPLAAAQPAPDLRTEPTTFEAQDGRTVEAELGRFRVPEHRRRGSGRTIELAFVRFPSTHPDPGPPIVYLAGGPGGSGTGTAERTRFSLFQSLRDVADVIAFDQRGTALSEHLPECPHTYGVPLDAPDARAALAASAEEAARACAAHWRRLGVDLAAYTTAESAADIDALRQALGADQVSLWAISYGTHLALATLRLFPESVARAVLAGVEGPDHTYKLPSDQQALLEEIDARHRAAEPDAPSMLDDLAAVLDTLRQRPVTVETEVQGETVAVTLSAPDVQMLVAGMLGGPESSMQIPGLAAALRAGAYEAIAPYVVWLRSPGGISAMSAAMDAASGASLWRRARIVREARETLLGDAINAPMPALAAGLGLPDLGPAFRAPVTSDVPTLFISGTLDGRTPVANADEVRQGFADHAHLVIDGAGHSDPLFLGSPVILERMRAFFGGEAVPSETIPMAP